MNENVVFMVVLSFLFLRQKNRPHHRNLSVSETFMTEKSLPARKKHRGNVTISNRGGMFLYSSSDCQQALAHTCLQADGDGVQLLVTAFQLEHIYSVCPAVPSRKCRVRRFGKSLRALPRRPRRASLTLHSVAQLAPLGRPPFRV